MKIFEIIKTVYTPKIHLPLSEEMKGSSDYPASYDQISFFIKFNTFSIVFSLQIWDNFIEERNLHNGFAGDEKSKYCDFIFENETDYYDLLEEILDRTQSEVGKRLEWF